MNRKSVICSSVLALLLAGCGSDSDSNPTPPTDPNPPVEPAPLPQGVFGKPDAEHAKRGDIEVSIATKILGFRDDALVNRYSCQRFGGPIPCNPTRDPSVPMPSASATGEQAAHGGNESASGGGGMPPMTADDVFNHTWELFDYEYLLDHAQIHLAKDGFTQSIRPDVFNDGYASLVDALLVAAKKYNLDVEYHFDEELGTYWIDSINGIKGMDPAWLPDNETMLVPYGECSGPGGWKAVYANGQYETLADTKLRYRMEEIYQRLDESYAQPQSGVIFIPACAEELELRKEIYRKEIQRKAENGGKVIIPEVVINFEWDKIARFENVEVKPNNLRSDIFKPGVLTQIDLILALQDHSQALEVGVNVWPKQMSSGASINSYHLNYMSMDGLDDDGVMFQEGHDADGASGWNFHAGEYERVNDTAYGMLSTFKWAFCGIEFSGNNPAGNPGGVNQSIRMLLPGSPCSGGDWRPGSGTWDTPTPDMLSPDGDPRKGSIQMGYVPYSWGKKSPYAPLGTYTTKDGITKNRSYFPHSFGGNGLHIMPDVVTMHNPEYFEFFRNAFFGGSEKFMKKQVETGQSLAVPYQFEPIPAQLNYQAKDISSAPAPLDETHFGWGLPDCGTCHKDGDNGGHVSADLKPFECAGCHGSNGAPKGHGEQSTCGFCHAKSLKHHGNAYTQMAIGEGDWNPVTDPLAMLGRQGKAAEYWGLYTDFPEAASCNTCHPSEPTRFIKD